MIFDVDYLYNSAFINSLLILSIKHHLKTLYITILVNSICDHCTLRDKFKEDCPKSIAVLETNTALCELKKQDLHVIYREKFLNISMVS